ncbi:hypothetical protein DJ69_17180 [Halorubrum persicum]|uniref:Uncharacterized protein n=1 Tax=Halorubrum persicum TaxID=1383844 RepID=A0A2G1WEL0_9EURY|nr:hypothetical protein [Halorubrum persicum]PHQ37426.1 hypothetical protein DJ69_17180 [Halorubrum persicum]
MTNHESRENLKKLGVVVLSLLGAVLTFFGLDAYYLAGIFLIFAGAGMLFLLKRYRAYSITMLIAGTLALVLAILAYRSHGLVNSTVLYSLLGVVGVHRGGQAYRATE